MNVKEIIKNVCIYLNKDEILNSEVFDDNGDVLSGVAKDELDLMLDCLNFVVDELASEYLPIYKEKEIQVVDNKITISDIDENIQDIVAVKTRFDKPISYRIIDGKIVCVANVVKVVYTIYQEKIESINANVNYFNGIVSPRVIAYGVASEFCFMQMLTTQANLWEIRYKNALLVDVRKKGSLRLKGRCWF